ncbi:MAG TPA: flagellar hook-length control protein FliK [Xanthobacteraceae bacterium]|nr:flagellar hook-length control protein FliK [Xanthobacteraceae bacterium]
MQSVASISSAPSLPAPAPDRGDDGNDSFSSMLDATAMPQPQTNPAPGTGPSADNEPPASRKPDSSPPPDHSARPKDDTASDGSVNARSRSDGAPQADDATAGKKDSGKDSKKQTNKDSQDALPVAVATDPVPNPQPATVVAVAIPANPDAPKTDGGANTPATDDATKAAAAVAAAQTEPPAIPALPAVAAQEVPQLPLPAAGALQTAAIDAAAKSAGNGKPAKATVQSGQSDIAPDTSKDAAAPQPQPDQKTLPTKLAAATMIGTSADVNSKPAAPNTDPSNNAPAVPGQPNTGDDKPAIANASAVITAAVKAAPDAPPQAPVVANHDSGTATFQLASLNGQVSQPATLPEPLRVLTASFDPASTPLQAPSASAQLVPATSAAIAVEIAARAKEGSSQFNIRLDPPDLGRIDVRLDVGKDGDVTTRLTVDRPETLSLLQGDARGLERALQSAGLKTEDGSLQFSLRQQSPDSSAGQQQAQGGTNTPANIVYAEEDDAATTGLEQYQWAARLRGGVDIRV